MLESDYWPAPEALLDLTHAESSGDGRVRCTAVAVCDEDGQPARRFQQGQPAHFFYEYEILSEIGVPAGGLFFRTLDGLIIHGKNSFQFDQLIPLNVQPGTRLRYHQTVQLDLGVGEYSLGVGLASTDEASYDQYRQKAIGYSEFDGRITRHSRVLSIATIQVEFGVAGQLSHHGLANLPSQAQVTVIEPGPADHPMDLNLETTQPCFPIIFHITHPDAGSEWLGQVLDACAPGLVMKPQPEHVHLFSWPLQAGRFYLGVTLPKESFDLVRLPEEWRRCVVIRDLRDSLVSAYYRIKTLPLTSDSDLNRLCAMLNALDRESGLLYLMNEWLPTCAALQLSWIEAGEQIFHYEDLRLSDDVLEKLLVERCGLPLERETLRQAIRSSQERKTVLLQHEPFDPLAPGIWRACFTPRLVEAFKDRYGDLLIGAEYEKDNQWTLEAQPTAPLKRPSGSSLIYIASYPRSGNTWARNLIRHYFDYYVPSLYEEPGTFNVEFDAAGQVGAAYFSYKTRWSLMYRRTLRNHCSEVFSAEFRQKLAGSPEHFFVKTHELPYEDYSEGESVVYLVRHPCATIWSYYNYIIDHKTPDVESITLEDVIRGNVNFGSWSEHVERWLEAGQALGDRFVVFRYEELAAAEMNFCQTTSWISGLPIRAEANSFPSFAHWQRTAPTLYRSADNQAWRKHFTPEHLELVRTLHGATMKRVGYTLEVDGS